MSGTKETAVMSSDLSSDSAGPDNVDKTTIGNAVASEKKPPPPFQTDYRFWMIMLTLSFCIMLASLEGTVVVTSLPAMAADLGLGSNYIWVTNVFLLTSAVVQPLFGQFSDLFGRKAVLLFVLGTYLLGSGICGGANSEAMLIAGRAVQGIGSGGLNMAADVIVSDLVPLRYRGNYISMLLLVSAVGFAIGPFVGGAIVENTTWRWVFYLNLPIGGVGMVVGYFFLNLKYDRDSSVTEKLKRIDYVGNLILMASAISILIALTWAGPVYEWSDARVLSPLIVGFAGMVGFCVYEGSGIPQQPVIPLRLFPNRTSLIIYANTFFSQMVMFWCYFFFPPFFQSVLLLSPSWTGVQMLPIALIALPGAAVSSLLLAKFGKFKYLHLAGMALLTVGVASLSVLEMDSTQALWVGLQIVPAIGSGFVISTMLPAFQASLHERDQAAATATWSFMRTFGMAWGIAIAGAVMNAYASQFAYKVDDPLVRELLSGGDAYASATRSFVMQFPEPLQTQIREVFLLTLRRVYAISAAFGGTGFVLAIFEKNIKLRKSLDTEFGLEERKQQDESPA